MALSTYQEMVLNATRRLRHSSRRAAASTLSSLAVLILSFITQVWYQSAVAGLSTSSYSYEYLTDIFSMLRISLAVLVSTTFFLSLLSAGAFEAHRKSADAVFQEVSNSVQQEDAAALSGPGGAELRIALRELAAASDLPIFPGRYGPAVYVGISVFALVSVFVFYVR